MQKVSTSYNAALPLGTFLYIIPLGGRCRPAIITETKRRISALSGQGSGAQKLDMSPNYMTFLGENKN